MMLWMTLAFASEVTVSASPVFAYHQSQRRFATGLGPEVSVDVGDTYSVGAFASAGWLSAPTRALGFRARYALGTRRYRPRVGTEVSMTWGQYRLLSSERPRAAGGPAWSVGLRAAPLTWDLGKLQLSGPAITLGVDPQQPTRSITWRASAFTVGWRTSSQTTSSSPSETAVSGF